ncbi:hypothetical protein B4135_2445 [Caldibacillus debilis]|uniref:Uncharacterized protein n=1 Tax=Caldibacillus debilis TaxID=301148 RepID=A0A150LYZ2_9BACI|nr:hypothetical protein B4135_2445 [Caldibacillus debilis]
MTGEWAVIRCRMERGRRSHEGFAVSGSDRRMNPGSLA